jgi:anti-sigma regulatory factor (Ser/Thr protein kinase)
MDAQSTPERIHLELPCAATAPRLAREAVRRALGTSRVCDDATLVVSELVTNAVRHSGCASDQTIGLETLIGGGCVRIAVHDPGRSSAEPRVRDGASTDAGGLGLRLVGQLARRWGSDRPDGRLVWAELGL